jgi:hypothetical protein
MLCQTQGLKMKMLASARLELWCVLALVSLSYSHISLADEPDVVAPTVGDAPAAQPMQDVTAAPLASPPSSPSEAPVPAPEPLTTIQTMPAPQMMSLPSNREIFLDRIQNLEQRLSDLNQEVNTSRATLKLIKEQVTGNFDADARITISGHDEVGDSFALVESVYIIDGKEVAKLQQENAKSPIVYDDFLAEGSHELIVEKLYRGNSTVFPYFQNYTFRLKGRANVETRVGQTAFVDVLSYQTGNFTDPAQDKLAIKFDVKLVPNNKSGRAILSVADIPEKGYNDGIVDPYLSVVVKDQMGSQFVLVGQKVFVDGQLVSNATPSLVTSEGQIIFQGPVAPGEHRVDATLNFQGDNKLFTYFKGYQFNLKFTKKVVVKPGFKTTVNLIGFQKPGFAVPAEQKPQAATEVKEEALRPSVADHDAVVDSAKLGG